MREPDVAVEVSKATGNVRSTPCLSDWGMAPNEPPYACPDTLAEVETRAPPRPSMSCWHRA